MGYSRKTRASGFTIVELLIVIVVIGILAALVIVSYNGVMQAARDKAVLSDAEAVATEVTRYSTKNNGQYGTAVVWYSGDSPNSNIVFTPSSGNLVDVAADNSSYCIRVYNVGSSTYRTLNTAAIKESNSGACTALPPSLAAALASPSGGGISGIVTTLAGSTYGHADATGESAQFKYPYGIVSDTNANIFVTDGSHTIRKITPSGVVSTLAGDPEDNAGFADGTGVAARFAYLYGIAIDSSNNLYVGDSDNNRIRKITPSGVVSTFAGSGLSGAADGAGSSATFDSPRGVAIDSSGNVYVADNGNCRIRKITPSGVVSTLAGSSCGYAEGTGSGAQFSYVYDVAVDSSDNVYVADEGNHRIRKITSSGVVSTLAGSGSSGYADGTGAAAQFSWPTGLSVDSSGNVYVADTANDRIRKITSSGIVTTIAGSTEGYVNGVGTNAKFLQPVDVTVNSSGILYVADENRIRKIQ